MARSQMQMESCACRRPCSLQLLCVVGTELCRLPGVETAFAFIRNQSSILLQALNPYTSLWSRDILTIRPLYEWAYVKTCAVCL